VGADMWVPICEKNCCCRFRESEGFSGTFFEDGGRRTLQNFGTYW